MRAAPRGARPPSRRVPEVRPLRGGPIPRSCRRRRRLSLRDGRLPGGEERGRRPWFFRGRLLGGHRPLDAARTRKRLLRQHRPLDAAGSGGRGLRRRLEDWQPLLWTSNCGRCLVDRRPHRHGLSGVRHRRRGLGGEGFGGRCLGGQRRFARRRLCWHRRLAAGGGSRKGQLRRLVSGLQTSLSVAAVHLDALDEGLQRRVPRHRRTQHPRAAGLRPGLELQGLPEELHRRRDAAGNTKLLLRLKLGLEIHLVIVLHVGFGNAGDVLIGDILNECVRQEV
mmetsp:Transcript_30849/g.89753  ORF Transcript_30849/g.89753 Transcript_30849/m.89753 type:complete len:280 (-) Transcript_30849:1878-2717(-)